MWVKYVLLELAVTLTIVLATIPNLTWARWIVIAYTALMVVLKVIALAGRRTLKSVKPSNPDVPDWFWHVNYAVNIFLLAADAWWLMVGAWVLIWVLSVAFERGMGPRAASR